MAGISSSNASASLTGHKSIVVRPVASSRARATTLASAVAEEFDLPGAAQYLNAFLQLSTNRSNPSSAAVRMARGHKGDLPKACRDSPTSLTKSVVATPPSPATYQKRSTLRWAPRNGPGMDSEHSRLGPDSFGDAFRSACEPPRRAGRQARRGRPTGGPCGPESRKRDISAAKRLEVASRRRDKWCTHRTTRPSSSRRRESSNVVFAEKLSTPTPTTSSTSSSGNTTPRSPDRRYRGEPSQAYLPRIRLRIASSW